MRLPARDRAEGKDARNDLLFSAAFATFVVLLSVDSTGKVPLFAPLPALLVALLFALAAVRRSLLTTAGSPVSDSLITWRIARGY